MAFLIAMNMTCQLREQSFRLIEYTHVYYKIADLKGLLEVRCDDYVKIMHRPDNMSGSVLPALAELLMWTWCTILFQMETEVWVGL